jgi:hypothetical protein
VACFLRKGDDPVTNMPLTNQVLTVSDSKCGIQSPEFYGIDQISDNFERIDESTITAIIPRLCVARIRCDYELTFDTVKGEFNNMV